MNQDNGLSAEKIAAIVDAIKQWQQMGAPTTFKKARALLDAGTYEYAVTKRGTNRMYLENGELRFDYLDRSGGERTWAPCDDHTPTEDDEAAVWVPIRKGETDD